MKAFPYPPLIHDELVFVLRFELTYRNVRLINMCDNENIVKVKCDQDKLHRIAKRVNEDWAYGLSDEERDAYLETNFELSEQAVSWHILEANKLAKSFIEYLDANDEIELMIKRQKSKYHTEKPVSAIRKFRVDHFARSATKLYKTTNDPIEWDTSALNVLKVALEEYAQDLFVATAPIVKSRNGKTCMTKDLTQALEFSASSASDQWMVWAGIPLNLQQEIKMTECKTKRWWVSKQTLQAGFVIQFDTITQYRKFRHTSLEELNTLDSLVDWFETHETDETDHSIVENTQTIECIFDIVSQHVPAVLMSHTDPDLEPWMPPFAFCDSYFGLQNFALCTKKETEAVESRAARKQQRKQQQMDPTTKYRRFSSDSDESNSVVSTDDDNDRSNNDFDANSDSECYGCTLNAFL